MTDREPHTGQACEVCKLHQLLYGETFIDTSTNEHLNPRTIVQIRSKADPDTVAAFRELVGLDPFRTIDKATLVSIELTNEGLFGPAFTEPKGTA